jgi:hypothetical protein
MTVNRWIGSAPAISQVTRVTIGTYDATTTYAVTINGKVLSVLGTGGSATSTATALLAALVAAAANQTAYPEFAEISWTASGAVVTATANTPGLPFALTASVSGGTGTISSMTPTSSSGPTDVSLAANWSAGLPANGQDVYVDGNTPSLLYNLGALSAVTLNSLTIAAAFSGQAQIGLPAFNQSGYEEYRPLYLALPATTVFVGQGAGSGSGLIRLDSGSVATTVLVYATSTNSIESGAEPLRWKGTNASNVLQVTAGVVGIARLAGESATLATLDVGYTSSVASDSTVVTGSGATVGTILQTGGSLTLYGGFTSIEMEDGTCTVLPGPAGTENETTVSVDGGKFFLSSPGAVTNCTVGSSGTLDTSQDARSKTITNTLLLYKGATVNDPAGKLILSGGFQTVRCRLADVSLNFGLNRSFTVT